MTKIKKIEADIDATVNNFMKHENETFTDAKAESAMTLVSLYPELKSDTLVKEQIKIHTENNKKN
ncbi:hypothetical protein MFLO_15683 [Listeria floridensis FSL S10-1187]|uniref:Uncharacterized protein n=1 Tax=Listeria floridensis FSL S10-1187 TaxID=1265817 RepID=A0ABN0RBB9_9LIST|nr:hypothetical protein [Listeria floridensis]EUJ24242.1 hypothetical protein MFLO_15683 [Listeria floridensis FSL S10-1187]